MAEYLIYTALSVNVYLTVEADNEKEAKKTLQNELARRNYDDFDLDVTNQLSDYLDTMGVDDFTIEENK